MQNSFLSNHLLIMLLLCSLNLGKNIQNKDSKKKLSIWQKRLPILLNP